MSEKMVLHLHALRPYIGVEEVIQLLLTGDHWIGCQGESTDQENGLESKSGVIVSQDRQQ